MLFPLKLCKERKSGDLISPQFSPQTSAEKSVPSAAKGQVMSPLSKRNHS